jgi:hypothetical protein
MFGIGSHLPILKTYWYSTSDSNDCRYEMRRAARELRDVACDAAEHYHSECNGWESIWPLDITLYESEEGPAIARFEVERETVPQFFAWERPLPVAAVDPQVADTGKPDPRV